MKLVRTTLLLGLGAFLLPSPPPDDPVMRGIAAGREPGSAAIVLAAMQAASDAGGFCARQPMVCSVAADSWRILQAKVKYSLRLAYEWSQGEKDKDPVAAREVSYPPLPKLDSLPSRPESPVRKDNARIAPRRAADGLITGSVTRVANRDSQDDGAGSENTLRIEDLTVPWNGPRG